MTWLVGWHGGDGSRASGAARGDSPPCLAHNSARAFPRRPRMRPRQEMRSGTAEGVPEVDVHMGRQDVMTAFQAAAHAVDLMGHIGLLDAGAVDVRGEEGAVVIDRQAAILVEDLLDEMAVGVAAVAAALR